MSLHASLHSTVYVWRTAVAVRQQKTVCSVIFCQTKLCLQIHKPFTRIRRPSNSSAPSTMPPWMPGRQLLKLIFFFTSRRNVTAVVLCHPGRTVTVSDQQNAIELLVSARSASSVLVTHSCLRVFEGAFSVRVTVRKIAPLLPSRRGNHPWTLPTCSHCHCPLPLPLPPLPLPLHCLTVYCFFDVSLFATLPPGTAAPTRPSSRSVLACFDPSQFR